jgi:RNA-directed DNA polymerase
MDRNEGTSASQLAGVVRAVDGPSQARNIRDRWGWVEPSVWTRRMLVALEHGVRGGKWFRLMDKVYAVRNLQAAFWAVWRNAGCPGVDGQTVGQFERQQEVELTRLGEELRTGSYQPHPVRRCYLTKLGSREKRPLGIPAVRDRVVQAAVRHVIEPIWEREFAETSHGFRPERGCLGALERLEQWLQEGYTWVVDADLRRFFDTIPHDRLMARLEERITDGAILRLIRAFLKQGVMEEMKGWEESLAGTPQGAVMSPLLANVYLNPLDHEMARKGYRMVRYADDFVILGRSQAEAQAALREVQAWVAREGLTLHPEKTRIVDATQRGGFEFLGWHYERGLKWPRQKSQQKLRETLRQKTCRTNGRSLGETIGSVNRTLRGWKHYFDRGVLNVHERLDQWIRMRLRSILRKRQGRKGRGRGSDHQRWPNAFFEAQGLYSLATAHVLNRQSHA